MFGNIGFPELILLLAIALLVFGPKKLPEVGRSIGKAIREFRRTSEEIREKIEEEIELEELKEVEAETHPSSPPQEKPSSESQEKTEEVLPEVPPETPEEPGRMKKRKKSPDEMTFLEHLEDLRKRIFYSAVFIVVAVIPAWIFSKDLFDILARPVTQFLPEGEKLAYTTNTAPFIHYILDHFTYDASRL